MNNDVLGPSLAMDIDPVAAVALASRHAAQVARHHAAAEARELCARLSDEQRHALVLACKGIPAKRAAQLCGINTHTVYTRRCRALHKLGATSMVEAAVLAAKAGLV